MRDAPVDQQDAILTGTTYGSAGRTRSFRWSHILFRAIWNTAWLLLASWTPPQLHPWRRILLNLFGARIARGARVYGSARIWYPPRLAMGKGAVLGPHVICYSMDRITLDEFAIVSQYAHLVTGTHDISVATFQLQTRPIHVRAHAWLASGCFVGPGVTIGEGAVLGARGVTFRNLDSWTVYAGNPAQRLKERRNFTEDVQP